MASFALDTGDVEFLQPEIVKPQPLRIIKRGQTVSSRTSTGRDVFGGRKGRSASRSTVTSQGSPTMEYEGPLTIRKKRQGKFRVVTGSLDDSEMDLGCESIVNHFNTQQHIEEDDIEDASDITPKATRGGPRTVSAGAFLKSELHDRSSEVDGSRYSVRGDRSSFRSHNQCENIRPNSPRKGPPPIPDRRPSKSKNFFLRALAGPKQNTAQKESTNSGGLNDVKDTKSAHGRRLSRGRKIQMKSEDGQCSRSTSISSVADIEEARGFEAAEVEMGSRRPSLCDDRTQPTSTRSLFRATEQQFPEFKVLILSPQIIITPEIPSVDTRGCHIGVAIEIRGQLRTADGEVGRKEGPYVPYGSTYSQLHDLRLYGQIHSMHVSLDSGPNCIISDIVGDMNELKALRAYETHLLLAKVHFSATSPRRQVRETSSRDLLSELQHDLGEALTRYLTVRIDYKHTGFMSYESHDPDGAGSASHVTYLSTEASAVIRRHNAQSAWSPRASQTIVEPLVHNPVLSLIERLLPGAEAQEAIRRMSGERPHMPPLRRFATVTGSGEEAAIPRSSMALPRVDSAIATSYMSSPPPPKRAAPTTPTLDSTPLHPSRAEQDDVDPARKIWTEMRRHSRRHDHARKSISADHYLSLDDEADRISSSESAKTDIMVEKERGRIREVALRNKRSVGQETLRSIAPSVFSSELAQQKKAGSIGVLGLGAGKSWWTNFGW